MGAAERIWEMFLTDKLTDEALKFLDETKRDEPFLLYFSHYTVRGPLMAKAVRSDSLTPRERIVQFM